MPDQSNMSCAHQTKRTLNGTGSPHLPQNKTSDALSVRDKFSSTAGRGTRLNVSEFPNTLFPAGQQLIMRTKGGRGGGYLVSCDSKEMTGNTADSSEEKNTPKQNRGEEN